MSSPYVGSDVTGMPTRTISPLSKSGSPAAAGNGTPIVAVSGIVGGRALRGPADRMLASLGLEPTALGVARIYAGIADRFVLDTVDRELATPIETLGMRTRVTDTVMTDDAARARLAAEVLEFAVAG